MILLGRCLGLLVEAEEELSRSLVAVSARHTRDPDIWQTATLLSKWCNAHLVELAPFLERYGRMRDGGPRRLAGALFHGRRLGGIGLLRDLHDLTLLAENVHVAWNMATQASKSLRDREFEDTCGKCGKETERIMAWLRTAIAHLAAQTLTVEPDLVASLPKAPSSVPVLELAKAAVELLSK
ncbi:MAG: hypothetical protein AUG74_09655 [Bacteroidetes bacterium 13_1_20CM_4_60_6]|nr:MAG: hypothetical protein AUG74_09655 [Bacteroidetes bacterium 13_1_20CM_4_60_6]